MKIRFTAIIITALMILGAGSFAAPNAYAQEDQTDLEMRYELLQLQMITLLKQQITMLQNFRNAVPVAGTGTTTITASAETYILPAGDICGVRYDGNQNIASIQQELLNQGFSVEKVDGKIGANTRAAVSAFQIRSGIKADGLIGAQTRATLAKASVACAGDAGVVTSGSTGQTSPAPDTSAACRLLYNGSLDIGQVQQALQKQGYAVAKIDGKIGPNTTTAVVAFQTASGLNPDGVIGESTRKQLARKSVTCDTTPVTTVLPESGEQTPTPTPTPNPDPTPTPTPTPDRTPTPVPTPEPVGGENPTVPAAGSLVEKTNISAGVRSTSPLIPDDTAVFTYEITFRTTDVVYVSTNASSAFEIKILKMGGQSTNATSVDSIISSGQKLVRSDGSSFFRIKNGDTLSMRSSAQPGAGQYYGELGRLTYTTENAINIQNPKMVNYGFDSAEWRSNVVTVLN